MFRANASNINLFLRWVSQISLFSSKGNWIFVAGPVSFPFDD